ncbi:MAG TPA: hypothetical protein DCZ10_11245 [Pelotomaculum sp.]|nr:hypothetical protein [Pelotomaculum sp.]
MIDWKRIYRLLENVTPLAADCGKICSAACCSEWEQGVGMYLLPGEEVMFSKNEEWLCWQEHSTEEYEFCPSWTGSVSFVSCNGACPRDKRPFACRTFPVVPYLTPDGNLEMRFDRAASLLCPLVKAGDLGLLERRFLARARLAWEELLHEPLIRDDVEWESRRLDREQEDPWKKMF